MPLEQKYLDLILAAVPALQGSGAEDRLSALYDRVVETNNRINITSLTSPIDVTLKHIVDSLSLLTCRDVLEKLERSARICDIGCGGGFPGLPIACARPKADITMIDSTEKKIHALKENAHILGLENVRPLWGRGEELAGKGGAHREKYDLCLSRAVAALPVLCELCLPFVKKGGLLVAMKGARALEELDDSRKAIPMLGGTLKETLEIRLDPENLPLALFDGEEKEKILSFCEARRYLLLIEKKKETLPIYPRKWAQMVKKPL
ncbi:MAG: 16S rRNA (guanine(527)-N(7))-methyltransferase RsmG [Clostridia bacterium]|nr:16S rRNA (guanine(527)-N(7))-methyltransferase RsmG [Clostridia bacterium]